MDNRSSSSGTLNLERIQAVIAALSQAELFDEESTIPPGLDELALEVIKTVKLTLAEFTEMEERPERFGGQENKGWHIIIRNVLGRFGRRLRRRWCRRSRCRATSSRYSASRPTIS